MGYYKELIIEYDDRGYRGVPEKNVCAKLFSEHRFIYEMIQRNGTQGVCDYCKEKEIVLPLDRIVKMVVDEFRSIFEDPAEQLPFESRGEWEELKGSGIHKEGGGYILPDNRSIMTTQEALCSVGFEPDPYQLFLDIANCFMRDDWVLKDAFDLTDDERLSRNWDEFWNNSIEDSLNGLTYSLLREKYAYLLEFLTEAISRNLQSLTNRITKGTRIFRCVNYETVPTPLEAKDLWAPPMDKATSQRMSRAGQSRLYASFDKETPLKEAVSFGPDKKHCLGTFSLSKDINVLDFTNIPYPRLLNVPDYFAYKFFYGFARDITKPIEENEKHKYIPTQIMRDIVEDGYKGTGIMGIKYNSSKEKDAHNIVLFLDNTSCANYLDLKKTEVIE